MRNWVPLVLAVAACSEPAAPTLPVPDQPAIVRTTPEPHSADPAADLAPASDDAPTDAHTADATQPPEDAALDEPVAIATPDVAPPPEPGPTQPAAGEPAIAATPGDDAVGVGAADDGAADDGAGDDGQADDGQAEVTDSEPEVLDEPEPVGPIDYTIRSTSTVSVLVRYDRGALIKGHDHVLVAQQVSGTVTWTTGDPSACRIAVDIPAASLVVDPPGSRRRAGLEGETSEKDKRSIRDNALGKSQLHADKFPTLTFRSTSCAPAGDRVEVRGTLNIRGVDKAVKTKMRIDSDPSRFSARGSLSVVHGDFGFKPFTAVLGSLRNDDKLTFDLDFRATN